MVSCGSFSRTSKFSSFGHFTFLDPWELSLLFLFQHILTFKKSRMSREVPLHYNGRWNRATWEQVVVQDLLNHVVCMWSKDLQPIFYAKGFRVSNAQET